MLSKIKELYRKNPTLTIIGGGLVLFMLYLLFSRIFARGAGEKARSAGLPLQVIPPGAQFQPPVPVPGEAPAFYDALASFTREMQGELSRMEERLKSERRDPHFIQELLQELPIPAHTPAGAPIAHGMLPAPLAITLADMQEERTRLTLAGKIKEAEAIFEKERELFYRHFGRTPAPVVHAPAPIVHAPVPIPTHTPARAPIVHGMLPAPLAITLADMQEQRTRLTLAGKIKEAEAMFEKERELFYRHFGRSPTPIGA